MNSTVRLGRLFGVPVTAHWSVLATIVAITSWLSLVGLDRSFPNTSLTVRAAWGLAAATVFMLSILGHEVGHALAARHNSIATEEISLWLLGGVAKLKAQSSSPKSEFQVAIAGPTASALIGVALLLPMSALDRSIPKTILLVLGVMNLVLALSNLLPGAPLDGGRILTAILWRRSGQAEKARLTSARVGMVLGVVLVVAGLLEAIRFDRPTGWATVLAGLFVSVSARSEAIGAIIRQRLIDSHIGDIMVRYPAPVPASTTVEAWLSGLSEVSAGAPISHWTNKPIGYLSCGVAARLSPPDRSWTTVGALMVSPSEVPRGWTDESCSVLLERAGGQYEHFGESGLVIVHDPKTSAEVGIVANQQLVPLFRPPESKHKLYWRIAKAKVAEWSCPQSTIY